MAYRDVRDGRTTLCHPGGPCFSSRYLEGIASGFVGRRLIFLDPRGTGASDPPSSGTSYLLQDYVADVEALRDGLGVETVDFVGHSHGSLVGLLYAAEHPGRVTALLLIATGARFHAEQMAVMQAAMERRSGEPWFGDASAAPPLAGSGHGRLSS